MNKMKAILAKDLSKRYSYYEKETGLSGSVKFLFRGRKVFVDAVKGIDLDIGLGEIIGFIGPNGAGKTTTLKMLSGILFPSSGHVEVLGYIPFRREKDFLKKITFVTGQKSRLFWDLPADEYFNFLKVVYEIPERVYQKNLAGLIEIAEIGDILRVPQRKLSVGQRRRCELVAALLHDPSVIFLDEPTNAVDLVNTRKIRDFIREKGREEKHTILLTSHHMADIEQVCDRVIIINTGMIVFDGGIRELVRVDGFRKQIRVQLSGAFEMERIEKLGEIKEKNGQEILLEVEPERVSSVASMLLANFQVKDISITDPPIEKVIGSLYLKPEAPDQD
jgi:ABC-2 type transport system ATP-binding protein